MNFFSRHAYDIGAGFASLVWPFMGKRRKIATENILRAFRGNTPAGGCAPEGRRTTEHAPAGGCAPEGRRTTENAPAGGCAPEGRRTTGITEREAKAIAKASVCHLAGHVAEALCVPFVVNRDNWREHLDFSEADQETVKLLLDTPDQPIILASAHHGVWEAATNVLSFARPMIAIARVQNNKFAERFIKKFHFRGPVTIIDKNNGFTHEILRQWKETAAAMTILMDQYSHGGLLLRFFGRPARTFTSVTRLAMRTGYPIVIGSFVRLGPYRYGLVGGVPLRFAKGDDLAASTQLLNDRLEAAIRAYPKQYLWAHRRWRDD